MNWVGLPGDEVSLEIQVQTTWKKSGWRGTWVRGVTPDGLRVGFWSRSKKAPGAVGVSGKWTVKELRERYTYLHKPRGLKWQT